MPDRVKSIVHNRLFSNSRDYPHGLLKVFLIYSSLDIVCTTLYKIEASLWVNISSKPTLKTPEQMFMNFVEVCLLLNIDETFIHINILNCCRSYAEWNFVWSLHLNIYELDRRVKCARV